jgi:PAS domain S-box-containing protein
MARRTERHPTTPTPRRGRAGRRPNGGDADASHVVAAGERGAPRAASAEHRLRSIVDGALDAILTIDGNGVIETFNAAAERMFGYSAAEAVGLGIAALIPALPPLGRHDVSSTQDARRAHAATVEITGRRKHGQEFPAVLAVEEIAELALFTLIVRDETEYETLRQDALHATTLEQRRIGQELHDVTQQELSGLGLLARTLSEKLTVLGAHDEAALAGKVAQGIAAANRHVVAFARGLVPLPVEAHGLKAALQSLANVTAERHGVRCRLEWPLPTKAANDNEATHLFRIAQEAVSNATRHASPQSIEIRVAADDGGMSLEVRDDGRGIAVQNLHAEGVGLRIMQHRCAVIGGAFAVDRGERGGTIVSCRIARTSKRSLP